MNDINNSDSTINEVENNINNISIFLKSKIIIHIIHCKPYHLDGCIYKYEEILHWLPHCAELIICHIGHHLEYFNSHTNDTEGDWRQLNGIICSECQSNNKNIKIYNYIVDGKTTYEKLYEEGILTERPTLIYCPHAGRFL